MSRALKVLRRLNRDSLPHYTRIIRQLIGQYISTVRARVFAAWWGIKLGSGNQFVGPISFARARGSTMSIGSGGRFLSSSTSNRHGLDRPCIITTLGVGAAIRIGDQAGFSGAVICAAERVEIGDRVMLGANVTVTDTDSHPIDYSKRHPENFGMLAEAAFEIATCPVVIGNDVFIGMHSLILKGVTIGDGAVVGAGSVVVHDLPPHCIAAGNPARVIRMLEPGECSAGEDPRVQAGGVNG